MKIVALIPYLENYNIETKLYPEIKKEFEYVSGRHTINYILDALNKVEGIDENNPLYRVNIVDDDIIELMSIDQNTLVSFLFFKNRLELIRYTDSIGVEHGIELRPL